MDFAFSEDQLAIKESVGKLCAQFDGKYWLKKDKEGGFPEDFYQTMADAGWLGIAKARHLPNVERPDQFNRVMMAWLAANR